VLWPETVKAIRGLPRRNEWVFNTRVRSFTIYSVVAHWVRYRRAAGVSDEVTFAWIRDAAYTTGSDVAVHQATVLAGHRLPGVSDNYLRRHPRFVADACAAIHRQFFTTSRKSRPGGQRCGSQTRKRHRRPGDFVT
jgi:hypothetical protein